MPLRGPLSSILCCAPILFIFLTYCALGAAGSLTSSLVCRPSCSSACSSVCFILISAVLSRCVEVAWTEDFPKRRVLHISTLHAKRRGCQASCDQPPLAWQALAVPASSILVGIRWQNVPFNSLLLLSWSTSLSFSSFRSPDSCKSAGRVGLRAVLSLSRTTSHAHSPASRFQLYSCRHLFRAGHRSFPYHLILILCTAGPTWQIVQPAHSHQFLYFFRPYSPCLRRIVVRTHRTHRLRPVCRTGKSASLLRLHSRHDEHDFSDPCYPESCDFRAWPRHSTPSNLFLPFFSEQIPCLGISQSLPGLALVHMRPPLGYNVGQPRRPPALQSRLWFC